MGVERSAEAVDEGDRTHPGTGSGRFGVPEQRPFHCPEKQPQYGSGQGRIAVQMPVQPLGQRQDPLAHRYCRDHMIHQVGRGLGHTPGVARRTDAAALTAAIKSFR
jgi:hypothetical protein